MSRGRRRTATTRGEGAEDSRHLQGRAPAGLFIALASLPLSPRKETAVAKRRERMEEQEPPIEQVHHDIHHHAETSGVRWISWVALSTAVLAALAAVASLHSGHDSNEATLEQIRASDNWAYYQAKGVKAAVLSSKLDVLTAIGKEPPAEERAKL